MKKIILFLLFLSPLCMLAQPISLYRQFNGQLDFTAVGNTLNAQENGFGYCSMLPQSSATLNLCFHSTFHCVPLPDYCGGSLLAPSFSQKIHLKYILCKQQPLPSE